MHRGYIKVWRKFQECFFYQDSEAVHLWLHLLLEANHKDKEFMFNGKRHVCPRGCFITGRKKLAQKTGINEYKVYRLLTTFENAQLIEQQKSNANSMITIANYNEHQDNEQQIAQPVHNGCTTDAQRMHTTNNVKNVKNEKNIVIGATKKQSPCQAAYKQFLDKYQHITSGEYITVWGKHCKLLQPVVKAIGPDEYEQCLDNYFTSTVGQDKKYSFDFFIASINSFRPVHV